MNKALFLTGAAVLLVALSSTAHAHDSTAHYVANEGVLVEQGDLSILFDPLPLSGLGIYPEPSRDQITDIATGQGVFKGVDVVFISHAHSDHFSARAMIAYLSIQPELRLVAPQQALDMMQKEPAWSDALLTRITALDMRVDDEPQVIELGDIYVTAVRIPHAGWPDRRRARVQNMVYRVTLDDVATVIHMGDADDNRRHYKRHADYWAERQTDTAFPPYWFLLSEKGRSILTNDMNIAQSVGIHVPVDVPRDLRDSGLDYFSIPGETRAIPNEHDHE